MDHSTLAAQVPNVLADFDLRVLGDVAPVPGGSLNWNFRAETSDGVRFVRRYRNDLDSDRILGEHALISWSAARGIPAPAPLSASGGETLAEVDGGRWAVFPWASGQPVDRGSLSPEKARALGALHGQLQATLARHPASRGATMNLRWDRDQSMRLLDAVEAEASRTGGFPDAIAGIRRQREILESLEVLPPEAFAALPCQLLHGDFHDQQVLFSGDQVSALVDWEIWHTDPRSWELLRSLAFSGLFETALMDQYLAGYRQHIQMTETECRLAFKLWWQSRVVGLWVWTAYFLEGHDRIRQFFPTVIAELDLVSDAKRRRTIEDRFIAAISAH